MTETRSWVADEYGRVLGHGFHDGQFVGLTIADEQGRCTISMQVRKASGGRVLLEFDDVLNFSVAQLWRGDIVSDLWAFRVGTSFDKYWDIPDSAWNVLFGGQYRLEQAKERAAKLAQDVPDAWIVHLQTLSRGGIAALCFGVVISQDDSQATVGGQV
jgi:hypothetical protein